MSTFPLYNVISKDIKNKDLTAKQKIEFIKKIDTMDENSIKLIYALIRAYSLNDGSKFCLIPYGGNKINQSDISFDLEKFPNKLKQILYKFIDVHDKSLSTE